MSHEDGDSGMVNSLRSISTGASLFFVSRLFRNGVSFGFNLLLTRTLGVGLYGIYTYGYTILQTLLIVTNFGADKLLMKFLPEHQDDSTRQGRILWTVYAISTFFGVIIGIGLFVLAPQLSRATLNSPQFVNVLRMFAVVIIFDTVARLIAGTFRALEQARLQVFTQNLVTPTLRFVFVAVALFFGGRLLGVVAAVLAASFVTAVVAVFLLVRTIDIRPRVERDLDDLFTLYRFSIPAFAKDTGGILFNKMDIFVVGLLLSQSAVGIYNAAVILSGLMALPLTALNQLFPPVASRLYGNSEWDELERIYSTVTRWSFTLSLLPVLGAIVFRKELLALFGSEFGTGTAVLVFFSVGQMVNSAVGPSAFLLLMSDHHRTVMVNHWVFGLSNVLLNYVFILEFGLIGAALATSLVLTLLNLVRLGEVYYFHGIHPYSLKYGSSAVAAVAAGCTMWAVSTLTDGFLSLLLGGIVGSVVFVTALFVLGFKAEDRELFQLMLR